MAWEGMGMEWCEKCGKKISANTTVCGCDSWAARKVRKELSDRAAEMRHRQHQEDQEREARARFFKRRY